jgi:hypothetical protein
VIVWLASFPRSGNTLVRILLSRVYCQPSYSLYEEHPADGETFVDSIPGVMGSAGRVGEIELEQLRWRRDVCFVKTHGLPLDDSAALCVVRDGRDALVSYAHFVRAYEPGGRSNRAFDQVLRMLIESRDHFGGWTENVRSWRERPGGPPTAWVRYEDLLAEPVAVLEGALAKLGIGLRSTGAAPIGFGELRRRWPAFFRRGTPGAWHSEMSGELHDLFWHHHEAAMGWFGYARSGRTALRELSHGPLDERSEHIALP